MNGLRLATSWELSSMDNRLPKDPTRPIYCHEPSQVPTEPHFAIVKFSSVYVPGDERSRTNPGHGYPGGHEPKAEYIAYTDKAAWEAEVNRLKLGPYATNEKFVAMHVQPAQILLKTSITIDIKH